MLTFNFIMMTIAFGFMLFGLYTLSDKGYELIRRFIFQEKWIVMEGVSSAVEGDVWRGPLIKSNVTNKLRSYRYGIYKLGDVTLREDRTGYYCGDIVWRPL